MIHSLSGSRVFKQTSVLKSKTNINQASMQFYEFYICSHTKNLKYKISSNYISTTKYNFITFLPKCFLLQFARLPNVYFLLIAILQSIPLISPLSSITAILPLVFVLSVSMLRELVEDIQRYKFDKVNNSQLVFVLRESGWVTLQSQFLQVGDLITVSNNHDFPCDLILLDSSSKDGICYIETGSLDGEKNLKTKFVSKETRGLFYNTAEECLQPINNSKEIQGECKCDMPNPDLYFFDGKLLLINKGSTSVFPLTSNQLLLKGAVLRQTKEILGIVTYTGKKNKIILNAKSPKVKVSQIERLMNYLLIAVFVLQIILCIVCSILHNQTEKSNMSYYKAFIFQGSNYQFKSESLITFFTYLLLLNTMIPISLIVTLEIVKVIQGMFIVFDCELYSKVRKQFGKVNAVSIIEELGKVNYIFTDKTGTLTCNKMHFKFCVIGDQCYQYLSEEDSKIVYSKAKDCSYFNNDNNHPFTQNSLCPIMNKQNCKDISIKLISNNHMASFIIQENIDLNIRNITKEFWLTLTLANESKCTTTSDNALEYTGISPDDIELVKAASNQGFVLLQAPNDKKKLLLNNAEVEFEILNIMPFTSERRRMSIIVRTKDNEIKLYIKGADSEIKKRLGIKSKKDYERKADKYCYIFSSQGYRTLFLAMRALSNKEYQDWSTMLKECELDLENKHKRVQDCVNKMEQNLSLLGVTIVEDKLQDKVPETIKDFRVSGIKIWMLTGDKIDTAENISLSCNLISIKEKCFKVCPLSKKKARTLRKKSTDGTEIIPELLDFYNEFRDFETYYPNPDLLPHFSILIESSILAKIFQSKTNTINFLEIALKAQSVICCRVSPLQKSQVINQVKKLNNKLITLSIGDGGNDVSMILEAHVGVGIYGEEGMLAVQSSDFAIGEFKYLRRLLFFHGRNSLNRTSHMILYFFYKNFLFTILHFYFANYSLVSGQSLIDDWFITLFNLLFTALPLGVQALSNFDILESDSKNAKSLMPYLYKESMRDPIFSIRSFVLSLLKALLYSLLSFFVVIKSSRDGPIDPEGHIGDIWYSSVNIYSNIIFVVSFSLIIKQLYVIWIFPCMILIGTFALYYSFCFYVHFTQGFNSASIIIPTFSSGQFYLCLVLICGVCFILDLFIHSFSINFNSKISNRLLLNKRDDCKKIIESQRSQTEANVALFKMKSSFRDEKDQDSYFQSKLFSKHAYTLNKNNKKLDNRDNVISVVKSKTRNYTQMTNNVNQNESSIRCQKSDLMKLSFLKETPQKIN